MSTPPVPPDRPEDDPTGIRELLSRLPDPGPMPPDLVERISASIAHEQAARHPGPVVVPLRRRSVWPKVAVAAAAAAVVGVGVPALLSGGGNPVTTAFSDAGRDDAGSAAGGAAAGSSGAGAEALTGAPSAPGPALTGPGTTLQPETRAARRDGAVSLVASGTAYTSSGLAVQAQRVVGDAGAQPKAGAGARGHGPADTDRGLRECLHGLGVEDWQPVRADLATYDGHEAVVAVVDSDTGPAVWVVEPGCSGSSARALAGPVPLG